MADSRSSRRGFLALGAATLTAGCAGLDTPEQTTYRVESVGGWNRDAEPHTLQVRLERDGDTVFDRTQRMEPATGAGAETPGGRIWTDGWSDDPAAYTVRSRLDDGEWLTLEPREVRERAACVDLRWYVRPTGTFSGVFALPCDRGTTAETTR
ncbi:hypothetical protein [Salarchaeum japonicum]|uniref:Lipoprotein n=1 Tax=Salarchaeum japonicum TaxID=555573 RepID=A0AAV3T275_9EURY|nr:hypothetical protein [Salarchaeum japonicum]